MRHSSTPVAPAFPTWRTLTLGTHKSVADLLSAFAKSCFSIDRTAREILQSIPLAETETEIELVLVSGGDLGFTEDTRRDALYNRAKALGLELVPAEVGPQLCLSYRGPRLENLMIGMEPIAHSSGWLAVFTVTHNLGGGLSLYSGGWWLYVYCGKSDYAWEPDVLWVFTRRRCAG